jgi:enoyl-CoA hydratase/carnithine racemase
MPEITIGLFPDVGASYFLNKMPPGVGKFLGLTGTSINGKDCLEIGLADYYLSNDDKDVFVEQLLALSSVDQASIDLLCNTLQLNASTSAPLGILTELIDILSPLEDLNSASNVLAFISKLANEHPDSKVLKRAHSNLLNGSPITAHLVVQQLQKSHGMSLANCFRMELSMAYQCSVVGEFEEGVRALLIDKDNEPKWIYKNIDAVPADIVDAHFNRFSSEPETHPLAHLERDYGYYG